MSSIRCFTIALVVALSSLVHAQADVVFVVGESNSGSRSEAIALTRSAPGATAGSVRADGILNVVSGSAPNVAVRLVSGADSATVSTADLALSSGVGGLNLGAQFGDLQAYLVDGSGAFIAPSLQFTLARNSPVSSSLPGPAILTNHLVAQATADPSLLALLAPNSLLTVALPQFLGAWSSPLPNGRAAGYNGAVGPLVRYFAFDTPGGGLAEVAVIINVSNSTFDTSIRMANAATPGFTGNFSDAGLAPNRLVSFPGGGLGFQGSTTLFEMQNTSIANALSPITIPAGAQVTMVTGFVTSVAICFDPTMIPIETYNFGHSFNYGTTTAVNQISGLSVTNNASFTPVAYPAWTPGCRVAYGLVRAAAAPNTLRFSTANNGVLWAGSPNTGGNPNIFLATPVIIGIGNSLNHNITFGVANAATPSNRAPYPALNISVPAASIL